MTRHHATKANRTITRKRSLVAAGGIVALALGSILWSSMPSDRQHDAERRHVSTLADGAAENVVERHPNDGTKKTTTPSAPSGTEGIPKPRESPANRSTNPPDSDEQPGNRDRVQRKIGINASEAALARVQQDIRKPVSLRGESRITNSISVKIDNISAVEGEARGIGEVAGPAVKFTATLRNNSDAAISTKYTRVTVNYGKSKHPATALSGPGVEQFPQKIKPGETGSATLVYAVPKKDRDHVRIYVNYKATQPIAVFAGAAPSAGKRP